MLDENVNKTKVKTTIISQIRTSVSNRLHSIFRLGGNSSDSKRCIYVNHNRSKNQDNKNKNFRSNRVSTSKYNILTFGPLFVYEQFRKFSNIFFLAICFVQQVPGVSPTGRFTTLVPLLFILGVSAIKEIIEDIVRNFTRHYNLIQK